MNIWTQCYCYNTILQWTWTAVFSISKHDTSQINVHFVQISFTYQIYTTYFNITIERFAPYRNALNKMQTLKWKMTLNEKLIKDLQNTDVKWKPFWRLAKCRREMKNVFEDLQNADVKWKPFWRLAKCRREMKKPNRRCIT